jgi:hypothetical protein
MLHMTISEIAEIDFRTMYNGILNQSYSIRDFHLWVVAQSNISYDEGYEDGFGGYNDTVQNFMEEDYEPQRNN